MSKTYSANGHKNTGYSFYALFLGVLLVPCVASGGVLMSTWICCIFWGHLFLGAPLDGCFWSSLGHVSQVWRCVFELARIIKILPFLNCFTIIDKVFGANSSFRVGWHTAGGVWFLFFKSFLLLLAKLSFSRGGWALGYHFMGFRHFPHFS